ncbi:endolytic transglycosylase MltG [Bacillus sp. Marseille-P3661]|uniref:endolytic transglycosylase MltG n=1 Tax=Bacillus sp. Marseille-P3661 TaxID=1936234 RepID=UPI000C81828B|nr:endolytic transglycosylase MltG [Bacillus sp. Marseille-P3661]
MANNSLRSFASGMIIATSIFTGVYYFQPTESELIVEQRKVTDADVKQYLTDKGHVSIPKEQYDELLNIKKQATSTDTPNIDSTTNYKPTSETQEITKKETQQSDLVEQENEKKLYTLEIKSGMNSIQISELLQNEGIVKSSKEFEQFLVKQNWNRSVQIGTYKLNSEMSYEQIGRIITKNN